MKFSKARTLEANDGDSADGEGDGESGAFLGNCIGLNTAAMSEDKTFDDRQADTIAGEIGARMEFMKDLKQFGGVLGIETDAEIPNRNPNRFFLDLAADFDRRVARVF